MAGPPHASGRPAKKRIFAGKRRPDLMSGQRLPGGYFLRQFATPAALLRPLRIGLPRILAWPGFVNFTDCPLP